MDFGLFSYQVIKAIATPTGYWAGPTTHSKKVLMLQDFVINRSSTVIAFFSQSVVVPSELLTYPFATPTVSCRGINQMGRSKTGSAGDVLIKDVCSWYSFPSLMKSQFGSHKDVSHTGRKLRFQKKLMGCIDWVYDRESGRVIRVTVDYVNVTLFEKLKLWPKWC